jgi:hypothetical protein
MADFASVIGFQTSSSSRQTSVLPWSTAVPTTSGSGIYQITHSIPDSFTEFEDYSTPNWDGAGAQPISKETIEAARRINAFLPREWRPADIAPGADGTIGFEWREGPPNSRKFVIVEVGPGETIRARKISETGAKARLAPVQANDADGVQHLISMLF